MVFFNSSHNPIRTNNSLLESYIDVVNENTKKVGKKVFGKYFLFETLNSFFPKKLTSVRNWNPQNGKSKIIFEFIEIACIQTDFEEAEWISMKQCLFGVLC